MRVLTLKLTSGEEIIGRFVREDYDTITLSDTKVITTEPNDELSIQMKPWVLTQQNNYHPIDKRCIISQLSTDDKIVAQYAQYIKNPLTL